MTLDFSTPWFTEEGQVKVHGTSDGPAHQQVLRFLELWNDASFDIEVQTSGSTGTPKRISIPKQWMEESASRTLTQLDISPGSSALLCISPFHIGGMMMIVRALLHQMTLTVITPSSLPLTSGNFDFTAMVPLQVQTLVKKGVNTEIYGTLIIGGAPISAALEVLLRSRKNPVYATFGMTETVSNIALRRLNGPDASPYFKCHPGIKISQQKDDRLRIQIPYMNHLDLITNDLVKVIDESTFLWKGRADGIINSGGVKLLPEAIESKLAAVLPFECFISSQEDQVLGERVTLIIESETLPQNVLAAIDDVLSLYERPKQIFLCPEFSRTETGKIKKRTSLDQSYLVWSREEGLIG